MKKINAVTYLVPFTTFIIVVFHFCTNVHSACGYYVFKLIVEIFAFVKRLLEPSSIGYFGGGHISKVWRIRAEEILHMMNILVIEKQSNYV